MITRYRKNKYLISSNGLKKLSFSLSLSLSLSLHFFVIIFFAFFMPHWMPPLGIGGLRGILKIYCYF